MPLFFSACPEEHKQSTPENQILHGATTDLSQVSPILNKMPRTHKVQQTPRLDEKRKHTKTEKIEKETEK